jgi:2,5-diketo-D-gluconate reductase A
MGDREAERVVAEAIGLGYRLIDTAHAYGNETGVGRGMRASGVPREELFVTTKLNAEWHGRREAREAFEMSAGRLRVDQIDLFLIHWPVPSQGRYLEAWKTLIELRDQGRVRSIGVSNFDIDHLERIIGETGVTPAVNQILLHPGHQQHDKRAFHKKHDIAVESYSPLGSGRLIGDTTIGAIARKHGRSPAQVMIRWHLDQGLIVIPKSVTPERIRENFAVFDFALDDDDRKTIAGMDDAKA